MADYIVVGVMSSPVEAEEVKFVLKCFIVGQRAQELSRLDRLEALANEAANPSIRQSRGKTL
jgi:hypothetical protein